MNLLCFMLAASLCPLKLAQASFWYPTATTSLLETILVQTHGAYNSGFVDAITPCTNYVSGSQNLGRETAAQWLRNAFHDFVTANVSAGTGGIDASIGFETLRAEDTGVAFNDSLAFFAPYVNAGVSMADLIAISVVISIGNCQGPQIPLRGGRIDATSPGPFGVPAPDTDLETTLSFFASAGFSQTDAIQLTACGHTMGSVHHSNFPTVVPESAVTPNNTGGGIHLDSTPGVFDDHVVQEYISGTGQGGGPLVTSFNVSSRSDLRLYLSDDNATMSTLAAQGIGFLDTCVDIMQRMIETVPKDVVLSDVIKPMIIKPINATLDLDSTGKLTFLGIIRILSPSGISPPSTVTLTAHKTSTTLTPNTATGTSVFGTLTYYPFNVPISDPEFSSFTISGSDIETQTFNTQSQTFIVPSLTSIIISNVTTAVNITVASLIRNSKRELAQPAFKVFVSAPVPQQGTEAPMIKRFPVMISRGGSVGSYELFGGSVETGVRTTGAVTVDIVEGSQIVEKSLLE